MSNVHGLYSNRPDEDSDDQDENNNRYVGGVTSRGGGSGLAVEPNPLEGNIMDTIRSNAEDGGAPEGGETPPTRRITMYRSGFTVDDGPFRRLDEPENAPFLTDLARGITPRELLADGESNGAMSVGLVDKRHMEYEDDAGGGGARSSAPAAFSGEGQSLGGGNAAASTTGGSISPSDVTPPPAVAGDRATTSIQVRLLSGKRLVVKLNRDNTVEHLAQHVNASGDAGSVDYVLSGGYPPRVVDDLSKTVEEAGLAGAQVMQKSA